ncbi:MAG: uroporphyrinogen decarboxylase family protein [Victivallaceae bacterium]
MMTAKENMIRTIKFQGPERVAHSLPPDYGSDFAWLNMRPNVDARPNSKDGNCADEWGAVWENIGVCNLGEVKEYPLKDWADFVRLNIPDIEDESRWAALPEQLANADKDKFLLASGISVYERIHFIRGLENTWTDIYLEPENLQKLIDILVDMNLKAIKRYAAAGADGYMFCDDWGLQNKLMISPDKWREFWKPAYSKIYKTAHEAGMLTFLHSCGYILEILDDLIEAGLDVAQLDQQLNMGLDALSAYKGRITFWCPVDIQAVMPHASMDEIRRYCHEMFAKLATPRGGFIAQWYADPRGAGHSQAAVDTMCREFLALDYRQL